MWTMTIFYFGIAGAVLATLWNVRFWALSWGATADELVCVWPGDELSPNATEIATRAITIEAPAESVWSWIVQLGQDRAGFYSYTWLENLFRCAMPRVEQIEPDWQERTLGDNVWMARPDRLTAMPARKWCSSIRTRVVSRVSVGLGTPGSPGAERGGQLDVHSGATRPPHDQAGDPITWTRIADGPAGCSGWVSSSRRTSSWSGR